MSATATTPLRRNRSRAVVSAAGEQRGCTEHTFVASDGQPIFYRVWRPEVESPKAVLLFHRGHEHGGRWQQWVDCSGMKDCWFFAWDSRGHGETPGPRGAAPSFARMVQDADEFARHLVEKFRVAPGEMTVVGQSVGAVLAAAWIHDYAPPVRAAVLATPAFRVKLYVPFALPALRLLDKLRPGSFIRSYVRPMMLTHDPGEAARYASDPLISPQIAVNVLLQLHDTSSRLVDDAAAIQTPTLLLTSGKDFVVDKRVQRDFYDALGASPKEIESYSNFYHSTFWERDRERAIERSARFLRQQYARPVRDLTSDQLASSSRQPFESLTRPLPRFSPRRLGYALQRHMLNTVGRLSRGVQIGWRDGFDSGQSLDHIYRNRAEGVGRVGRFIDRGYLDAIGWKGIRQRKVHLEETLDSAIQQAASRCGGVRILDIAAGPGRYVLESMARNSDADVTAVLCDRDSGGLDEARTLAEQLGLADRVEFRQSDAFDPAGVVNSVGAGHADIVIVSGLYELFPDNRLIAQSLRGISQAIASDGVLIYTNQPWHPQQERIARVLPNRDGEPWVMRCRSQREIDALVAEAGFQKQFTRIDRWGIFTVSAAKRPS